MSSAPADRPLVLVDADVLGRRRTGDETFVRSLLGALQEIAGELRLAAVTRHPELVPTGVQAISMPVRSQALRLGVLLPRLLRQVRPAVVHTLYALPPALPCPSVVTVQDVSFELAPDLMRRTDALLFRAVVRAAVRRAARVMTCSERTRRDLIRLYGLPEDKVVAIPYGVDPIFAPGRSRGGGFLLCVGAVEPRKNLLAAADAAREVGLSLVVAGPVRDERLARELWRQSVTLAGYVSQNELARLYRDADCLLFPSRFEGFGFPVLEAMASGTPVVCSDEPALRETAGDAAVFAANGNLSGAVEQALRERERLSAAGIERARRFTWRETALRTLAVYREAMAS